MADAVVVEPVSTLLAGRSLFVFCLELRPMGMQLTITIPRLGRTDSGAYSRTRDASAKIPRGRDEGDGDWAAFSRCG